MKRNGQITLLEGVSASQSTRRIVWEERESTGAALVPGPGGRFAQD